MTIHQLRHTPRIRIEPIGWPQQIAIVGCGPKGLFALEQLALQTSDVQSPVKLNVTIYEPATHLGAGQVYALDQPHFLRMNLAARHVCAWSHQSQQRYPADRLSLVDWLALNWPNEADPDGYPPRAIVGAYLRDCYQEVLAKLPAHVDLRLVTEQVIKLDRQGSLWRIATRNESAVFDQVLLTVGHEGWRSSELSQEPYHDEACFIESAFPVETQLGESTIPADSTVAVRGFSLTWVDTALALSEGRGGLFVETGDTLRYERSGREPRCLIPFSRTGRPILAKPNRSRTDFSLPESLWADASERLAQLADRNRPVDFQNEVWPLITGSADQALRQLGQATVSTDAWLNEQWLGEWSTSEVLRSMRQSCDVAIGKAKPDPAWALGEAWRQTYPGLVQCCRAIGLAADSWDCFTRHAAEMERIAFGPPARNLRRLVALVDAKLVSLDFLQDPTITWQPLRIELSMGGQTISADYIVNAVLPTTCYPATQSPLRALLRRGWLTRDHTTGGIRVDEAGRAVDSCDRVTSGLSVIGRPTEGCVLGNDTLSRALHDHPARWATSVVATIQRNHRGTSR